MIDISVSPNAAIGSNCTLFSLLHDLGTTLWDCVTCIWNERFWECCDEYHTEGRTINGHQSHRNESTQTM
jgi:hypothetical protein